LEGDGEKGGKDHLELGGRRVIVEYTIRCPDPFLPNPRLERKDGRVWQGRLYGIKKLPSWDEEDNEQNIIVNLDPLYISEGIDMEAIERMITGEG